MDRTTGRRRSYTVTVNILFEYVADRKITLLDYMIWNYIKSFQWRNPRTGKLNSCTLRATDMAKHFGYSHEHVRRRLRNLQKQGLLKIIYRAKDIDTGVIQTYKTAEQVDKLHTAGLVIKKHSYYRTVNPKD